MSRRSVWHAKFGNGVVVGYPDSERPLIDFGYMRTHVPRAELRGLDGPAEVGGSAETRPSASEAAKGSTKAQAKKPSIPQAHSAMAEAAAGIEPVRRETPPPPPPEVESKALPEGVVRARRAILALKLGQVLEQDVQTLSVGVNDIQARLERALSEATARRPQSLLIEGAWGAGKTHLLTLLASLARDRQFATSRVILDGEGVTLWEPMGLMGGILGSLRYSDEAAPSGIGQRLRQVRRQTTHREATDRLGRRLAHAILDPPKAVFEDPDALDVLEDYLSLNLSKTQAEDKLRDALGFHGLDLPKLQAWHIADRGMRFADLLVGWTEFCVLTGAKGLVVVLDEVDVEYAATDRPTMQNEERQGRRNDLFQALSALRNWHCPLVLAFGSAPVASPWSRGREAAKDLSRCLAGLATIGAPLPSLGHVRELGRRLCALYEQAHGPLPLGTKKEINDFAARHMWEQLNPTPRDFVRGVLERLDVASCKQAAVTH